MHHSFSSLEPLEARIAPAAMASLVFTDVDGDRVKLTVSKGTQAQLEAAVTTSLSNLGVAFQKLDLTLPIFKGANVTFQVIAAASGGNGVVSVGAVDATGIDLGTVTVPGELGQIDAGDTNLSTPAVKLLKVGALGGGASVQAGGETSQESELQGSLTKLDVAFNVAGTLRVVGSASAGIGSLHVGGALLGNAGPDSGSIVVQGAIGNVKIDGNFSGGGGAQSGSLHVGSSVGTITIGGSLLGGIGLESGSLVVGKTIDLLQVAGSVVGSAGDIS